MLGAYSQDLRDRVIEVVEQEGMSCRSAARRFGVGESTAITWLEHYRSTGRRTPVGTGGHRPSVLKPHRDFLYAVRAEQPDITPLSPSCYHSGGGWRGSGHAKSSNLRCRLPCRHTPRRSLESSPRRMLFSYCTTTTFRN